MFSPLIFCGPEPRRRNVVPLLPKFKSKCTNENYLCLYCGGEKFSACLMSDEITCRKCSSKILSPEEYQETAKKDYEEVISERRDREREYMYRYRNGRSSFEAQSQNARIHAQKPDNPSQIKEG